MADKQKVNQMIGDQIAHIAYQAEELAESCKNLSNFIVHEQLYSVQPYSEIRRSASMGRDVADAVNELFGNVPRPEA